MRRYGPKPERVKESVERILSRVRKTSAGCWIYHGKNGRMAAKHAVTTAGCYTYGVHRLVYMHFKGPTKPWPTCIDHLCCVPQCVNPKHLEEVSSGENTKRGKRHRLQQRAAKAFAEFVQEPQ